MLVEKRGTDSRAPVQWMLGKNSHSHLSFFTFEPFVGDFVVLTFWPESIGGEAGCGVKVGEIIGVGEAISKGLLGRVEGEIWLWALFSFAFFSNQVLPALPK